MAMARRTWSVAAGLARDTLGENLTCPTPSKDCFPECNAMRSEGFPFNCGGLGAGGVFTRCFGPRSREDSMAGPLGNCAEGGPGGEEGGGVPKRV